MPTRRLPDSVYWRRRVVVLLAAATMVFVIANWLTGGSDASDGTGGSAGDQPADLAAQQAGAAVGSTAPTTPTAATPGATSTTKPRKGSTPTLAAPTGACAASDVVATPSVSNAVAGRDVTITLSLQTVTAEACTFDVTHDSVAVRIGSGNAPVWSTQQCPKAIADQSAVVRKALATVVQLSWNARKSAPGCRADTQWVLPGAYTVVAAALGGEPAEADFRLAQPAAATVTVTPPPARSTRLPKKPTN